MYTNICIHTRICINTQMHKHTGRHTNTNANTSAHTFAVHGQCISKIDVGFTCGWADNDVVKCYDGHQCAYPRRLASTVMNQHVQMLKTNFIDNTNFYREAPDSSLVHQHRNDVPPSPGCHMFKFINCKYHDRKIDRLTNGWTLWTDPLIEIWGGI